MKRAKAVHKTKRYEFISKDRCAEIEAVYPTIIKQLPLDQAGWAALPGCGVSPVVRSLSCVNGMVTIFSV